MRKIGVFFLSTMLILSVLIIAVAPDEVESSGAIEPFFSAGDGSEEDPYQISTLMDLAGIGLAASTYYIIVNDIDASATSSWNGGEGFIPIGDPRTGSWGTWMAKDTRSSTCLSTGRTLIMSVCSVLLIAQAVFPM